MSRKYFAHPRQTLEGACPGRCSYDCDSELILLHEEKKKIKAQNLLG